MAVRNSWETQNKTYSIDANIQFIEHQLASVLYMSGLDGSVINLHNIDDSLAAMRQIFKVEKEAISVTSPRAGIRPAFQFFIRKNSSKLAIVLRRNNRWLKIANYIKENQNG